MLPFADLHCHTLYSDGSLSPAQLIELAAQRGLKGFSVTDHDTFEAYDEDLSRAKELGLRWFSGIEFSCVHRQSSVHILGYAFALKHPVLRRFCAAHVERRERRNAAILQLLKKEGMPLQPEEIMATRDVSNPSKYAVVGRVHIALAMVKKGYVQTLQEAFDRYLGDYKSCYDPGEGVSVETTIDCIHVAGGKAVIAHPHLVKDRRTMRELMEMPFDGIEAFYGKFGYTDNSRWVAMAQEKGWLTTGGSDFHGSSRSDVPLGCCGVNRETFEELYHHFQKHALCT